jgi:glycosyltransferase involved in cell wall biosynthesis
LKPRVLYYINAEWYFWSHRLALAKAVRDSGCEVVVAAGVERGYDRAIESEGFRLIRLRLDRGSRAPHKQLRELWEAIGLYRRETPDLAHNLTIKPVLYGALAARLAHVPAIVNTIPGLGYTFLRSGIAGWIRRKSAALAYQAALSIENSRVIFQNPEDRDLFVDRGLVPRHRTSVIRGSGVDIAEFVPGPEPPGPPVVMLASRLLWDKGVGVLVEAAEMLKRDNLAFRVVVVGIPDLRNPNSVPQDALERWSTSGLIEWWGMRDDMPNVLRQAAIVALPTFYPEGVPRILIEAAATGRPIIATDAPGCREIVLHGKNGLLVPARNARAVADAIVALLRDPDLRTRMGAEGRRLAVDRFSKEQVIAATLSVYRELMGARWPVHPKTEDRVASS